MFKVEFVGSEIFGPELHYLTAYKGNGQLTWPEKYTGDEWPGTKRFKFKSIHKSILFLISSKNIFQVLMSNNMFINSVGFCRSTKCFPCGRTKCATAGIFDLAR